MVFEVKQACFCCCAVFLTQNRPSHTPTAHAGERLVNMTNATNDSFSANEFKRSETTLC